MKKLLILLFLAGCIPFDAYTPQQMHDIQKKSAEEAREAALKEKMMEYRDVHGCLKSKCFWHEETPPHCVCEGDSDYNLPQYKAP